MNPINLISIKDLINNVTAELIVKIIISFLAPVASLIISYSGIRYYLNILNSKNNPSLVRNKNNPPLEGKWIMSSYGNKRQLKHQNLVRLKQKGDMVEGVINRTYPYNQIHRKWKFIGIKRGYDIIAIFIAVDENVRSNGCAYLTLGDDFIYTGNYFKMKNKSNQIIAVPLEIKKDKTNIIQKLKKLLST